MNKDEQGIKRFSFPLQVLCRKYTRSGVPEAKELVICCGYLNRMHAQTTRMANHYVMKFNLTRIQQNGIYPAMHFFLATIIHEALHVFLHQDGDPDWHHCLSTRPDEETAEDWFNMCEPYREWRSRIVDELPEEIGIGENMIDSIL